MLVPPIAHLAEVDLDVANRCLVAWGHRMGPFNRPYDTWCHALFEHGEPVAVVIAATLVRETCAGLDRSQAIELARLCAARPHLCRPALRLWREMVLPALARAHGYSWAVSYQDAVLHTGDTYRFDGWLSMARSRSGTDQRSGRKGRSKVIWGWPISAEAKGQPA
jgi:hypothetical protein